MDKQKGESCKTLQDRPHYLSDIISYDLIILDPWFSLNKLTIRPQAPLQCVGNPGWTQRWKNWQSAGLVVVGGVWRPLTAWQVPAACSLCHRERMDVLFHPIRHLPRKACLEHLLQNRTFLSLSIPLVL
jgi:hypothetical protein